MIYKFKSKATGDLIMLGPQGDTVMRLLGREPAAQGIIDVADMPHALSLLEQAVADDEAARGPGQKAAPGDDADAAEEADRAGSGVSLRQRVWPLVEAIKRAHSAGEPLVWGV
jgi:hypothetical protein